MEEGEGLLTDYGRQVSSVITYVPEFCGWVCVVVGFVHWCVLVV